MAVFPPFFPNLVEVRAQQTMPSGAAAVNVLYVERDGTASFAVEAAEIAAALETFYDTIGTASLSTEWSFDDMVLTDRSAAGGEVLETSPGLVGGVAANPLPPEVQLVATLKTGNSGRRYRGRVFIGGWTEDSNGADGRPLTATVTVAQDAADDLLTDLAAGGHSLQVLSRGNTSPPAPAAWAAFHTPVTTILVDRFWDTLRSRRR